MKNKKVIIIILGIALLTGLIPPVAQQDVHAQTSVSFQLFYDQLSPFGTWVNYPDYGYVWVPGSGSGFRPYGSRGHWVYTDEGWAWVSDYSWGWATFHYGNWFYDDSYGWMWMPGYQWAPAWVTWGEYQGNYCWAPVGPRVDIGVSFGTYRPPYQYWNFCPRQHITSTNINNYYVTSYRNTTVINKITVINNVNRGSGGRGGYLRGPAANNVERFTHQTVRPMAIRPASRPGTASVQGGQLAIYRPTVQNNNNTARPAAVRDLHSLRPVNGNHPAAANRPGPANHLNPASPGQPARQPAANRPASANHPATERPFQPHPAQPANPGTNNPRPAQPHTAQPQPHPVMQPHPAQPQPHPAQPQPHPAQPRPMQQAQPQRPMPQPHPVQPRPQPQRPMQQPHPAQPHPAQQQRPVQAPRPVKPPPHQNPPQQPQPGPAQEHHR